MTRDIASGLIAASAVIIFDTQKRKRRRWWTRQVLSEGPAFGNNLLNKLRLEDAMGFRNFTRLTPSDVEDLLQMVGEEIPNVWENFPSSTRISGKPPSFSQVGSHAAFSGDW